jgi:hypothetical protein
MQLYTITPDYLTSDEFKQISEFMQQIRADRLALLERKYPNHQIRSRVQIDDNEYLQQKYYYISNFGIPFYDFALCESNLHQGTNGYIEINEYAYQMNIFCTTIFHRKKWNTNNQEKFLNFVYDNWKKYQFNNEFDLLEEQANKLFDQCETLLEYHQQFVYNNEYEFITLDQVRELFDQLVDCGIWLSKQDDLYQVYENTNYDDAVMDPKVQFHSGRISKLDELHIRSVFKTQFSNEPFLL